MPENAVVTVVVGGYLWIYTLTAEQIEPIMAEMGDNISHFTRITPGKDDTVFGCAMCNCKSAVDPDGPCADNTAEVSE